LNQGYLLSISVHALFELKSFMETETMPVILIPALIIKNDQKKLKTGALEHLAPKQPVDHKTMNITYTPTEGPFMIFQQFLCFHGL